MQHLPLFARLDGRRCLVVGGGDVGARKVRLLLAAGAEVTVAGPALNDELRELRNAGKIHHLDGEFVPGDNSDEAGGDAAGTGDAPAGPGDIRPYWLIIAATSDRNLNAAVARAAESANRFCNVVDDPELGNVIMPAIVDRAPVTVAVSTGGSSPVLARWLKGRIESMLPMGLGAFARLAGRWRSRVSDRIGDLDQRRRFWEWVLESRVPESVYAGREAKPKRRWTGCWPSGIRSTPTRPAKPGWWAPGRAGRT